MTRIRAGTDSLRARLDASGVSAHGILVRPLALLLIALVTACDDPLHPTETQDVFSDASVRVTMTLVDRGGFPDRIVDYDVVVATGSRRLSVLRDQRQVQSVSHRTRATRLGAMIVVALRNDLCLVDASARSSACVDLESVGPETSGSQLIADALAWRATDASVDITERDRASIALAWLDPGRGLVAVHTIDSGTRGELNAELDGTRARLTHDRDLIRVLGDRIGAASSVEVLAIARTCVPELAADLADERARLPNAEARTALDAALASCRGLGR